MIRRKRQRSNRTAIQLCSEKMKCTIARTVLQLLLTPIGNLFESAKHFVTNSLGQQSLTTKRLYVHHSIKTVLQTFLYTLKQAKRTEYLNKTVLV